MCRKLSESTVAKFERFLTDYVRQVWHKVIKVLSCKHAGMRGVADSTRYIHCCGSVTSPGAGVDMGGCNKIMHNINTHILCVTIVVCTYRSVAMVACCCTSRLVDLWTSICTCTRIIIMYSRGVHLDRFCRTLQYIYLASCSKSA